MAYKYSKKNSVLVRRCTNPTTVNGIEFPLNFSIAVDVLSIHNDPELWGPVDTGIFFYVINLLEYFVYLIIYLNNFLI